MEFQQWFAAFSTCVDKTSLVPQFKMLRLEGCLRGEAAETIKGLGYSLRRSNIKITPKIRRRSTRSPSTNRRITKDETSQRK